MLISGRLGHRFKSKCLVSKKDDTSTEGLNKYKKKKQILHKNNQSNKQLGKKASVQLYQRILCHGKDMKKMHNIYIYTCKYFSK